MIDTPYHYVQLSNGGGVTVYSYAPERAENSLTFRDTERRIVYYTTKTIEELKRLEKNDRKALQKLNAKKNKKKKITVPYPNTYAYFKRITNIHPHDFIKEMRLEYATIIESRKLEKRANAAKHKECKLNKKKDEKKLRIVREQRKTVATLVVLQILLKNHRSNSFAGKRGAITTGDLYLLESRTLRYRPCDLKRLAKDIIDDVHSYRSLEERRKHFQSHVKRHCKCATSRSNNGVVSFKRAQHSHKGRAYDKGYVAVFYSFTHSFTESFANSIHTQIPTSETQRTVSASWFVWCRRDIIRNSCLVPRPAELF